MQRLTHIHTHRRKQMVSPLTGKLTIYELVRTQDTCSHFTANMTELKTGIQNELTAQSYDAQVEACSQIQETNYDYLLTDIWMPAASPIAPLILLAIILIATIVIGATITIVSKSIHDTWIPTQKYYCDICGAEFGSIAELTAHRRMAHPEVAAYQCPYCGSAFATAEELNKHVLECPLKPKGADWGQTILWIIVGVGAVAAIVIIVPKVLH